MLMMIKLGYSYSYDDGVAGDQYWDGLSSSAPMIGAYRVGYKDGYKHGYADGKNGNPQQEL